MEGCHANPSRNATPPPSMEGCSSVLRRLAVVQNAEHPYHLTTAVRYAGLAYLGHGPGGTRQIACPARRSNPFPFTIA